VVCTPREDRAGYPSRVCSILGAESAWGTAPGAGEGVDRIAEAIDQLESDLRAETGTPEMSARVADIWLMVTALDPELARLVTRYTAPGSPSDGIGSLRTRQLRLASEVAGSSADAFRERPGAAGGAWCIRAALWRRLWIPSTGPVDSCRG